MIKDFGIAGAADISEEDVLKFARELAETVVARIKATGGSFECPVCYDAVANPASELTVFVPCTPDYADFVLQSTSLAVTTLAESASLASPTLPMPSEMAMRTVVPNARHAAAPSMRNA